ncbi:MAG: PilX N-terminal domain-containing pilus assembly protein [Methylococcales bacterium]
MTIKTTRYAVSHSGVKQQSGVVLIVSLIMLLLLTLIGVSATQSTGLEEKMAGNFRNKDLAFQAAESALRVAEASLVPTPPAQADFNGTNGLYASDASPAVTSDAFWADTDNSRDSGITSLNVASSPRYIIQRMNCVVSPPCTTYGYMYRITAWATGGTANAVVILESNFQY